MPFPIFPNLTAESMATAVAAANTDAVITLSAAGVGVSNVLLGVYTSYSAAPTGGLLQVSDGATVIFQQYVDAAARFIDLTDFGGVVGTPNTAMTITLKAGGSGIIGAVNAIKGKR